jgi:hypothetical protein
VTKAAVMSGSLEVVARLTQWLMVALVPKQLLIAVVWPDVIDHSSWYQQTYVLAIGVNAVLMLSQVLHSILSPAMVVAALMRRKPPVSAFHGSTFRTVALR